MEDLLEIRQLTIVCPTEQNVIALLRVFCETVYICYTGMTVHVNTYTSANMFGRLGAGSFYANLTQAGVI